MKVKYMADKKLCERISKEDFFEYLDKSRKIDKMIEAIYQATNGEIDLINFNDTLTKPFRIIERNFFSNVELDMISWYLWEYDEKMMKIYSSDDKHVIAEILTDEDLWEYLNRDDMECWKIYYPSADEEKEENKSFEEIMKMIQSDPLDINEFLKEHNDEN